MARGREGARVRHLGTLEVEVMQRLWDARGPVSVRDVLDDLNRERNLAYTTVMTVLENLYRKGLLERKKDGRAFKYVASMSREQYTAELMDGALAGSGDRGAALLHFVERMSATELAELREALGRLREERDGS